MDQPLQAGIIEVFQRLFVGRHRLRKIENALIHVTGDVTEFFDRIIHQDLKRLAHLIRVGCLILVGRLFVIPENAQGNSDGLVKGHLSIEVWEERLQIASHVFVPGIEA